MNNLLPVFMNLKDQPCLVVGGGKIALQKINQLLECHAQVTVVAPKINDNIKSLSVQLLKRRYYNSDIQNKQLVIAATNDMKVNQQISFETHKRGIPVNVVDQPELCSFYMGSVYLDGDLKVAISTNGKCPSFGSFLRDHIHNMSKNLWGKALDELAIKRENIIQTLSRYSEKKKIMEKLVIQNCKKVISNKKNKGKVYLVGAGPGDPELITAKGLRAIQNADIILYDALIHPYLVFEINPLAKKIFVGKRENKHSVSQEAIHSIMAEEATKGKLVVRLKGGDPFIFGRGGEEIVALSKADIHFEVIPGVTAGVGAAAGFGIPLTHREDATSALFITGHQCMGKDSQNWEVLAQLHSTLVFYMGVRRVNDIVSGLLKHGKSQETPIAIIQNATMKSQNIITSTLGSIIHDIKQKKTLTPAIIIIGNVVNIYSKIQKCLKIYSSDETVQKEDIGFDIWKNPAIVA